MRKNAYEANEGHIFGVMVHSASVAAIVRDFSARERINCHICVTTHESALDDAAALLARGCEVLVCHGGSREVIYCQYSQQTVFIERSDMDLLKALLKAGKETREVILTAHETERRDIALMESLTGMHIHDVRYMDQRTLERKLAALIRKGVRVAVGGGATALAMARLGGTTFLDEPRPENIRVAFARALALARSRRMEQNWIDSLKDMLAFSKEGMLFIGTNGKVLFANAVALRLFNVESGDALAPFFEKLLVADVLADARPREDVLVDIRNRKMFISSFPVSISAENRGVVVFIHDVESLQGMNLKIRKNLHERGFIAKHDLNDLHGDCAPMRLLKRKVRMYAATDAPVLIHGETGSGKELVAHSLHMASPRYNEPFVPINCSALPENLLESELFGYEEGAFTGARKGGKQGLFELAHKGTLFLDEIGGVGLSMQARLLRVLEAKEIMRVGGDRIIPVDVRILSASHTPLHELITQGRFRADLFYRLRGLSLSLPPLRERGEDILRLARWALARRGKSEAALLPEICARLMSYHWPGNVRELMAVIDTYAILLGEREHDLQCFLEVFDSWGSPGQAPAVPQLASAPPPGQTPFMAYPKRAVAESAPGTAQTFKERLARIRLDMAREALAVCGGNQKRAARQLGLSYTTFRRLLGAGRTDPADG